MSSPFIGEIRMFGGNFAPAGWALCNGQLVPISENDALFNLIGTTYGGDGQSTFGLPDLQGRVPIHQGTGGGATYGMGEKAGVEQVTLTTNQIPIHNHALLATTSLATQQDVSGNLLAQASLFNPYINVNPAAQMAPQAVSSVGGSQPHNNLQPFLCINFIISLFGVFPSQT
jgi:microcystin-dependent protein